MKVQQLLVLAALCLFFSCQKSEDTCIACEFESNILDMRFDHMLAFNVPNIIITDLDANAKLGIEVNLLDDDYNLVGFEYEGIDLNVYNENDELIFQNNVLHYGQKANQLILWNGNTSVGPYSGSFIYDLRVEFTGDQYLQYRGVAQAISCEELEACATLDSDCDLTDCLFFPRSMAEGGLQRCPG